MGTRKIRKVMLTLELKTDFPRKEFSKQKLQNLFDQFALDEEPAYEMLTLNQVTFQVVAEDK